VWIVFFKCILGYVFLVSLLSLVGGGTLLFLYLQVIPILAEYMLDVFLYYSLSLLLYFDLVLEFFMVLKF
jgi:hypothetical protein